MKTNNQNDHMHIDERERRFTVEVLGGIRGVEDERLFETEVGARMDAIEEIRSSEVMSEPEEYEMGKKVTRRKRRNNHFGCEIYLYK